MNILRTRTIAAAALLMLGFGTAMAQPKAEPDEPKIQYVGGITLCANNPKALAQWYTEKFGLDLTEPSDGKIYWGRVLYKDMEMDFGIHPAGKDCPKAENGFVITFHVDNYARYADKLKSKGLVPDDTADAGKFGKFAYYSDIENNKIAIWGN
jgi:predicted enzyme related to lactoylglutathione lyase